MTAAVGVDVGGTEIKIGLVGASGELSRPSSVLTSGGPDDTIAAVTRLVERFGPGRPVGVVVPGIVDEKSGTVEYSKNLGWRDVPVRQLLEARLDGPVVVGHDVRAGGLAEHRIGAACGSRSSAFVPIGTGIAAALVLDGRLYSGGGFAGELGHVDVGHGLTCICGGTGCLEAIGSAAAIGRRYAESTHQHIQGGRAVAERVRQGDPEAVGVWDDALDGLSRALAMLVGLVAPDVIVLGGGLVQSADLVIEPVRERLDARLTFHRTPRVEPAALGRFAACVGAGLLAFDRVAV